MVYDSLLLGYSGGIFDETDRISQDPHAAHMVIGIGGNGIDALTQFKSKLLMQICPDEPEALPPRYAGIPLLAIDSDESQLRGYRGLYRLENSECFSLAFPVWQALRNPTTLIADPFLNWMDLDDLPVLPHTHSACGIRQVGRFLLTRRVQNLVDLLTDRIMEALLCKHTNNIDVYVLAGLGGGTGSGCFIDVCYLLRRIAHVHGVNMRIHGYFFPAEVMRAKVPVMHDPHTLQNIESNCYAALKELDYLMDLERQEDTFSHTYAPGLQVDTQAPPVDACYLVSSANEAGVIVPDGYHHACDVAAEHILHSITYCTQHPVNPALMSTHSMDVDNALADQPALSGCKQCYHTIGAVNAEIPRREIFTYLACGFFDKLTQTTMEQAAAVGKSDITQLVQDLHLTIDDLLRSLTENLPTPQLPAINPRELSRSPRPSLNCLPEKWAIAGNDWIAQCEGVVVSNAKGLTLEMDSFDYDKVTNLSLIGRVFHRLWEVSVEPGKGPRFAARLLLNEGHDLPNEIHGAIWTVEKQLDMEKMRLRDITADLEACKDAFYGKMFVSKHAYCAYEQAACNHFRQIFQLQLLQHCLDTLHRFRTQLTRLYNEFFRPLCRLLDDLRDTFAENGNALNAPLPDLATRKILDLQEIHSLCNPLIADLTPQELVTDFVGKLLTQSDTWLAGDPDQIARMIRRYMVDRFPTVKHMTMEDHLYRKYPHVNHNPTLLRNLLASHYAPRDFQGATPLFWATHEFPMEQAVRQTVTDVPFGAPAVIGGFQDLHLALTPAILPLVRHTDHGYRSRTVNTYSGIALYALRFLQQMHNSYRIGGMYAHLRHLYSPTGRGPGDGGQKDWSKLPDFFPASLMPELQPLAAEAEALYTQAEKASLICRDPASGRDVLLRLPPIPEDMLSTTFPEWDYTPHFCRNKILQLEEETNALRAAAQPIDLPFQHPIPEQQRRLNMDHLVLSPVLRQLLSQQLKDLEQISRNCGKLESLIDDLALEDRDLKLFSLCMFCGIMGEPGDLTEKSLRSHPTYLDLENPKPIRLADTASNEVRFPMYSMFVSFRAILAIPRIREALTQQVQSLLDAGSAPSGKPLDRKRVRTWIACIMGQAHLSMADTYAVPPRHVRAFFERLRDMIDGLVEEKREPYTGLTPPPPPPPPPGLPELPDLHQPEEDSDGAIQVLDLTDGAHLKVYPHRDPGTALDPVTGQTRPVHPDMLVWGNQQWFHALQCKLLFP